MARPKEFNRDTALGRAVEVFARRGYGGTSTEELLTAMGIGRQSFYDTFGSKRELYVEALRRYNHDQATEIVKDLQSGDSAREGISRALFAFLYRCEGQTEPACLGTSAICEFGNRDPLIAEASEIGGSSLLKPLVEAFRQAQTAGEVRRDIEPELGAHFFLSTLTGLKVGARAGLPTEQLRKLGALALQALD